jgi:hypothetical protein
MQVMPRRKGVAADLTQATSLMVEAHRTQVVAVHMKVGAATVAAASIAKT